MTTEIVKTLAIVNAEATPMVVSTIGEGAPGFEKVVTGSCAIASGVTAAGASHYHLARIPSNAKVKKVELWLDAAGTTITGDIGIYYSGSTKDGTPSALQGTVINADHFGSAVALAAVVTPTEYTFEAGTYLGVDLDKPLWNTSASGLTADPMCLVDVAFTLTSTAGSAAQVNGRVTYVE
jgi:hypothetical protein